MLALGFLLLLISEIYSDNCVLDDGTPESNREWILNQDLHNNNNLDRPPCNNTKVVIRFVLKSFTFDEQETIFSIFSWVFFSWEDDRYTWKPEDYGDLTETSFDGYRIWTPKLKPFSSFDSGVYIMSSTGQCLAKNTGHVSCIGRLSVDTECNNNLTRWPFDTQKCTFKFGTYNKDKNAMYFTFNSSRGVSMLAAEYGPGWNIIDFEKGENRSSETQFYLTFVVERQGVGLATVTTVPAFVLSVLTVTTLFLADNTRLTITLLSLIGHFYFLKEINELIPKHGSTTPTILHYVSGSVIFTSILLITCFVLNFLRGLKVKPVSFIVNFNDFLKKTPVKFIVLNVANPLCIEEDENIKAWTYFANVINTFTIIIAIVVYLSAFIAYVPRELPIDYDTL